MTKKHSDRDEETRDLDVRDTDLRPAYNFEYINPYDLPEGVYREGYKYHWGRYGIRGVSDNRIEKLLREGWDLVPASRTKQKYLDPLGQNPFSGQWIFVNNCLLLERHERFSKEQEEYYNRETAERTRSTAAQVNNEDHLFNANSRRF